MDTEKKPSSWTFRTEMFSITVTTGHIYYKGKWVMHCFTLGMDTVPMVIDNTASPEEAQALAVKMVHERMAKFKESLNNIPA